MKTGSPFRGEVYIFAEALMRLPKEIWTRFVRWSINVNSPPGRYCDVGDPAALD